jgi:hypothetical protein
MTIMGEYQVCIGFLFLIEIRNEVSMVVGEFAEIVLQW